MDLMFFGEFLINTTLGKRPDGPAPSPLACVGANVCMRMSGRRSNMSMAVFFSFHAPCVKKSSPLRGKEREREKKEIDWRRPHTERIPSAGLERVTHPTEVEEGKQINFFFNFHK